MSDKEREEYIKYVVKHFGVSREEVIKALNLVEDYEEDKKLRNLDHGIYS